VSGERLIHGLTATQVEKLPGRKDLPRLRSLNAGHDLRVDGIGMFTHGFVRNIATFF